MFMHIHNFEHAVRWGAIEHGADLLGCWYGQLSLLPCTTNSYYYYYYCCYYHCYYIYTHIYILACIRVHKE